MNKRLLSIIFIVFSMTNISAQLDNSVFAIVKISYNTPGESPVIGGICGTGFLIKDSTVLTANHVLNKSIFTPNNDYKYVQFWLLKRGTKMITPLSVECLESMEDIESTIIKIPEDIKCNLQINDTQLNEGDIVENFGHLINMPITSAHWDNNILIIDDYNLDKSKSDASGQIVEIRKISVNANDVKLNDITVIQPSFKANVGMSGGPLIFNNKIIGMMSFGLPADSDIKDIVFAISIDQITAKLK